MGTDEGSAPDECTSIQASKPVLPWERPGCFRLDGIPHRGNFLWWLATLSFALSVLALLPFLGWMPGLLGIAPCVAIRWIAKHDLAKMRTGLIDPRGRTMTADAAHLAKLGVWFSLAGTVIWGSLILLLSWLVD